MELDEELKKLGWSTELIKTVNQIAERVSKAAVEVPVLGYRHLHLSDTTDSNQILIPHLSNESNSVRVIAKLVR